MGRGGGGGGGGQRDPSGASPETLARISGQKTGAMSTCNENLFDHPFTLQPNNDAGSTGTAKSDLHRLYHNNEPRSRYYYCCRCIDEDSEAQKYQVTCPRSHKVASGRARTGTQQFMPLSVRLLLVLLGDGLFAGLPSPPGLYLFGGQRLSYSSLYPQHWAQCDTWRHLCLETLKGLHNQAGPQRERGTSREGAQRPQAQQARHLHRDKSRSRM